MWSLKPWRQPVREWSNFRAVAAAAFVSLCLPFSTQAAPPPNTLVFQSQPEARFQFAGMAGPRIQANIHQWLIPAPAANPGLIQMFHLRDRQPAPNLVPWAGEFVGKYLISGVQALRMSAEPELEKTLRGVVSQLIASQANDGYLGPFPQAVRLKANWDLWGHYHCLLGLMLWHEHSNDAAALAACRRAADLACNTFLDSGIRVLHAGSPEMNMAFIHGLGRLHRLTREPRYLRLMREIEEDWKKSGDYLRTGLAGVEFFQTPLPRWESLHDLQGLAELHRITGEDQYRQAFLHHWRSILRWDRRNGGGFSSGEQATGNPYAPTAIETCCTVSWMALTLDALALTGDARAADELELSTYNAGLGAQHPSGRWWTYNTPMDGAREASAHSIVFQARPGTPELNCCSVNGPRVLGMLSEWAVMTTGDGLAVNSYERGRFQGRLPGGAPISLRWDSDYPAADTVEIRVDPVAPRQFTLKLRIPGWANRPAVSVNNREQEGVEAGSYLAIQRRWAPGDRVKLEFHTQPRILSGDREAAGKVSVYWGPILMAFDQADNAFDEKDIPSLDLSKLSSTVARIPPGTDAPAVLQPALVMKCAGQDGRDVALRDFASAGASGSRYRSWLPAASAPPGVTVPREPRDGAEAGKGKIRFRWTRLTAAPAEKLRYDLTLARDAEFQSVLFTQSGLEKSSAVIDLAAIAGLEDGRCFWKVTAANAAGRTDSAAPPSSFVVKSSLPASVLAEMADSLPKILVKAALRSAAPPEIGQAVKSVEKLPSDAALHGVALDGAKSMVSFALPEFPEEDYAASARVQILGLPEGRVGQVICGWTAPMDDPLRVCVEGGKLYARIEAGQSYSTPGVPVEAGRTYHIVAMKRGASLKLYVDGKLRGETVAPLFLRSNSREIALGGNPRYQGPEFLAMRAADFQFFSHALSDAEVAALAK